jgi:EpsI family protein
MTISRLSILGAVLAAGFSLVFLIPKSPPQNPASVRTTLPESIPGWTSRELPVSAYEQQSLGLETRFAKRAYRNPEGDEVQVIVVFSGSDMNTSIHRPERCLPAQGWTIIQNSPVEVPLPDRSRLAVTRLKNLRSIQDPAGRPRLVSNIAYYWFVGHRRLTRSHLTRSWVDVRDRILWNSDQRWAYLTASAVVTAGLQPGGKDEAATDTLLAGLVSALWPRISLLPAGSSLE